MLPKLHPIAFLKAHPRIAIWVIQLSIFAISGTLAFLLRFDLDFPGLSDRVLRQMAWAIPLWVIAKAITFYFLALDRGWWRYVSLPDLIRIMFGNLVGSSVAVPFIALLAPSSFPRSVIILDLLICFVLTGGSRVIARIHVDRPFRTGRGGKKIFIYGAGEGGVAVLAEIRKNPRLGYTIRGFVDDDERKMGMRIQNIPVLGAGRNLAALASRHAIEEVLIAIPSADGSRMTTILRNCHDARLRCKTVPALVDMIQGHALIPQIRDVAVEDLLGRIPVCLDETAIRSKVQDKIVLLTGAGGSIGSELCRQIARFHPGAIIGYDVAETPLFEIGCEMRRRFPDIRFVPEVGSIQNQQRLAEIFESHAPSVVYHAAAYKHVPMMEAHLFEAIENNVVGTWNVAVAAAEHGVTDFVMISSDKAVRPTNVMGATKRIAELVINSLQNGGTKYVSVRFGNVLGSNGSVIPIFKKQIAAGGPVTVTHPEMRRYFMTIPEAVQLVLQASTMGNGGEIFVLDMGQPVRIVDLARNLILLCGLRPDDDIRIEFTGVRPGEKLYEELSTFEESTLATFHEKIKIFSGPLMPFEDMQARLDSLRRFCQMRDAQGLLLEMKEIVPEYNPSTDILRRLVLTSESKLGHIAARTVRTQAVGAY